jgi:maleate isomerase
MYGWRGRIGHVNGGPATVGQEEWRAAAPEGVCFVGARMTMENNDSESLAKMLTELERAAREVALADADVIIQCGTLAAIDREKEIRERIEKATGVAGLTVLGSIAAALTAIGAQRVALASPYTPEQNSSLAKALTEWNVEIVASRGLSELRSLNYSSRQPHEFYQLGREVAAESSHADTVLLCCGNTRTFEILEPLEWDTGLKVVSSNQAALWNCLRKIGVGEPIERFGALLRDPNRLRAQVGI